MPAEERKTRWIRRLPMRVVAFLSVALLPLGLLAVLQTRDLTREVRNRSELSLLALTDHAAFGERQILERSLGAAEALSSVIRIVRADPASCVDYLRSYLATTDRFSYVGFIPVSGTVQCASTSQFDEFAQTPLFASLTETPSQYVGPIRGPHGSPDVAVFHPLFDDNLLIGYIVLSVPQYRFIDQEDSSLDQAPIGLILFNNHGDILATAIDPVEVSGLLPRDHKLTDFIGRSSTTFATQSAAGPRQLYAFTEIVPGVAQAIAIWPANDGPFGGSEIRLPSALFPMLMWIASLGVAVLAVHRLVVRHVQRLSREMRRFAVDRKLPKSSTLDKYSPYEMQELEFSFMNMAHALLNDEAQMEDNLREKNILLKEVHHRVKNNLQMISSIMNMKIRKARSPETRFTIRRLQERVLGLATVHRNLYQTDNLTRTDAGALLREVIAQFTTTKSTQKNAPIISLDMDKIIMFPDQAVPFSLMGNEIATNAMKHVSHDKGTDPWINISLKRVGASTARMICANSIGAIQTIDETDLEAREFKNIGLGTQLIRAFVMQLDAEIETEQTDHEYRITVTFEVEDFRPEPPDF